MRGSIALCLILWSAQHVQSAQPEYPHVARSVDSSAVLRSGPGEQYYATHRLEPESRLEIYRREPGGWLAVRPPDNSFSWVAASNLRPTDDPAIMQVVGRRVVSWIGSETGKVRDHKWQVQLDPGERLQVLGRESLQILQDAPAETFVKVAPPAGEFRWIHERFVRPDTDTAEPSDRGTVQPAQFQADADLAAVKTKETRDRFTARGARESERATGHEEGRRIALLDRAAPRKLDLRQFESDDIASRIQKLDLQLAREVAQPPLSWDLAPLRQQIGELTARADSTLARARARRVQQKLEEFAALHRRYQDLQRHGGAGAAQTPQHAGSDDIRTSSESVAAAAEGEYDPRFDGLGWLLPVHSSKRQSPPYALLDSNGNILQFVSPAPGLNLHRYLRQEVGIFGQKDRTQFLDKPHLTAHRVIDVARHRR